MSTSSPYQNLQKTTVLQECRLFHEANPSPKQVTILLTKLIQLICSGEQLTQNELQEIFFAATKLYPMRDPHVRRLLSLVISLLAPGTESSFIVTSCLLKDLNSPVPELRSTAFRVLARIMDPSLSPNVSRQTREALNDQSPLVQAAAFLCARSMLPFSYDTVSRWTKEAFSVLNKSSDASVQIQCISFLAYATRNDVKSHCQTLGNICEKRSRLSTVPTLLLISLIGEVLNSLPQSNRPSSLISFLSEETKSTSHSISVAASRVLITINDVSKEALLDVQSSLKYTLSSAMSLPIQKLAAARTIELIKDDSVSSLFGSLKLDGMEGKTLTAITLAIKFQSNLTASEASVELKRLSRLLRSLGSDSLRIKVLNSLCFIPFNNPGLSEPVLTSVGGLLREEGSLKLKNSLFSVVRAVAESNCCNQSVADFLSDLIEDCEFSTVAVDAITLLGKTADLSKGNGFKYIRSLINRLLLENTVVRCAALTTLAKLLPQVATKKDIYQEIYNILEFSLFDLEDEVRDTATYLLKQIQTEKGSKLIEDNQILDSSRIVLNGEVLSLDTLHKLILETQSKVSEGVDLDYSISELITSATASSVSPELSPGKKEVKIVGQKPLLDTSSLPQSVADKISGEMLSIGTSILSEEGFEYSVSVDKYVSTEFNQILLISKISHLLSGQVFVDPSVLFELDAVIEISNVFTQKADNIGYESESRCFMLFNIEPSGLPCLLTLRFMATLKYTLADADPEDASRPTDLIVEEEQELDMLSFDLDDVSIPSVSDPMTSWSDPECEFTITEALKLPYSNTESALSAISSLFGSEPVFKTSSGDLTRTGWDFFLIDDSKVLIRAEFAAGEQVLVKLKVKSNSEEVLNVVNQLFF
ncbi:hypothetical protein P9112_009208 [Eukaryota sp. TZLM1-RC]